MTGIWSEESGDPSHPLVALVHGAMDRSAGLLKVSRRLSHRFRVLRYDRRGYGRSVAHPGPFEMREQVDDLVGLLHGRAAVLVGHSFGGTVALATAQRVPELVRAVAVYEAPLSWEPWWPGNTIGATALAAAGDPADAAERFLRRMLGDDRWEALPERTRAARRSEGVAMVAELTDARDHVAWDPARLHVPVAAAHGDRTAAHHERGTGQLAATVPGATLVVLPGCRHDAPTSHPELFVDALVRPALLLAGPPWSTALRAP